AAHGPAGIALIDGDKRLPQPNPNSPRDHVKFIQLNCRESENLYLTDEVLAAPAIDWNTAGAKIAAERGKFGGKAARFADAGSWDRKNADIKDLIEEVSFILDEKHVHWTIRTGVAIGRITPAGQRQASWVLRS